MAKAGKILIILGALLTIVGTYVIALYGGTGAVGSGIGFILNIPELYGNSMTYITGIPIEAWIYWTMLILMTAFIAAGALQLIGLKSRTAAIIFSLLPLGVGIMFLLVFFTTILGPISAFFTLVFIGDQFGNIFPFMIDIGGGIGIGAFFIVAGGVLGLVSGFLPRD